MTDDVAELVRRARQEAFEEALAILRTRLRDELLEQAERALAPRGDLVALAGIADGVRPLVLELRPDTLDEEQVRAHNELLLGALADGAVVPFRFGTTFPDRAALDEWVELHRAELAPELERLRGTAEWSVEVVGTARGEEPAGYLEARLATAVRPDVRERLEAASVERAGHAYLVADRDAFAAVLDELEAEGYELRVTGPWPAYSFARLP